MKRLINSILGRLGYRIQKKSNSSQGFTAERIRKLGKPKTIIDVGVADGTFPLYDAFPDKNIVLIEPMAQKNRKSLTYIKRQYSNVFLIDKAAGEVPEETTIYCESNSYGKTSLLKRTDLTKEIAGTEKVTVRVDRLDRMIPDLQLPGPFGIKIDTEGYELKVMKGAEGLFNSIEFVIAEVSIAKRFEDSYSFEEMIQYMHQNGFQVTDMLSFFRPDPVGTRFLDLVFKRRDEQPN